MDTALTDYTLNLGTVVDGASGNFTDNVNQWVITAVAKSAAATASELGISEDSAGGLLNANDAVAGDATIREIFSTVLQAGGANAKQLAEQVQGTPSGLSATSGAATAAAGGAVTSV